MHSSVSSSTAGETRLVVNKSPINHPTNLQASPISHTIASQISSATSTVLFYPLDTIRMRFMSQDGTVQRQHNGQTYASLWRSIRLVWREEGPRALFRGCHVAVGGAVCSWGVYMYLYRSLSNGIQTTAYATRASASIIASLVAACVSSPVWLIKARMQIEEQGGNKIYTTFRGSVVHVVRSTGVRSLWRGTSLQMLLVFPNALSFPTYDMLKGIVLRYHKNAGHNQTALTIPEVLACSAVTKTLLVFLSHPLMLLKIRLQDQRSTLGEVKYTDIRHSLITIHKREGVKGLLRGCSASLLHTLPRSLMHFILYEKILELTTRYP